MRNVFLYSYNTASEGGRNLAQALGIKRIKHEGSRFRGGPNKVVINWGASVLPGEVLKCRIINRPEHVAVCSNKLWFFQKVKDHAPIPEFTTSRQEALGWLGTGDVCVRALLRGHSGRGLEIVPRGSETLPEAPLYTKYIKKRSEYRIHVLQGAVIDVQEKKMRRDWEGERNTQIRNHANGYIFARENVNPLEPVLRAAVDALASSELDFGAVDIIWNEHQQKAYVLEINTAPGIEGTTVENYKEVFTNYIERI